MLDSRHTSCWLKVKRKNTPPNLRNHTLNMDAMLRVHKSSPIRYTCDISLLSLLDTCLLGGVRLCEHQKTNTRRTHASKKDRITSENIVKEVLHTQHWTQIGKPTFSIKISTNIHCNKAYLNWQSPILNAIGDASSR